MVQPVVLPRAEHSISRRDIDPDALKVLYRLHQFNYTAYLVGGSVRDLLLGRQPKDFDIGTSAHPYQVKRLFRNCWIIGRRFRLAHVKFGTKTIEVATFRRNVPAGSEDEPPVESVEGLPLDQQPEGLMPDGSMPLRDARDAAAIERDRLIQRDNTFGTPEEDAFRRDFTVNALFYDIATFSIIDYVGGLSDLAEGVIRSIGDPDERFQEDPVRMVRALALAARLEFVIDGPVRGAIERRKREIARSSPARLLDECFKILRAGAAEETFRALADTGLLAEISPAFRNYPADAFWQSLERLDRYRERFSSAPETLTTPVLIGTLLVPLGFSERRWHPAADETGRRRPLAPTELAPLPVARRDIEQLRHILILQHRLIELTGTPRTHRTLLHRAAFRDALTWLEIHGDAPDVLEHWNALSASPDAQIGAPPPPPRRRRRRRRRTWDRGDNPTGTKESPSRS